MAYQGTCRIATRGSKLALWQANTVAALLRERFPGQGFEVVTISTTGDEVTDRPLDQIGDKGMFTKQLEAALVAGEAELAVHSMKDVPTTLAPGCTMAAMLPRADVRDCLVCGPRLPEVRCLADLPAGARVGSGSLRRAAQLHARFPQIEVRGIRGNVDTRLAKAHGDDYDAAILAVAGVERLGRAEAITARIPADELVPATGQGAIGIEAREDDMRAREWCAAIDDAETHRCVDAERLVLGGLGGSCKVPIGAYCRHEEGKLAFDAIVLSVDGSRHVEARRRVPGTEDPLDLARAVLDDLVAQGAHDILREIIGEDLSW